MALHCERLLKFLGLYRTSLKVCTIVHVKLWHSIQHELPLNIVLKHMEYLHLYVNKYVKRMCMNISLSVRLLYLGLYILGTLLEYFHFMRLSTAFFNIVLSLYCIYLTALVKLQILCAQNTKMYKYS